MQQGKQLRDLDGSATYALRPGDDNFRAYVGPPSQYDVMGATQFCLLSQLGLRETHRLLDFGCGSLRAGRLLIPYLLPENYHGLEPNRWLLEDAIEKHIGRDQISIKRPHFHYDSNFSIDNIGKMFDYIVAQSVFSHTGSDLVRVALSSFGRSLTPSGLVVATFIHPEQLGATGDFAGEGWVYPGCVAYREATIESFFAEAKLACQKLNWYHPRQTWYIASTSAETIERHRSMARNTGFEFT